MSFCVSAHAQDARVYARKPRQGHQGRCKRQSRGLSSANRLQTSGALRELNSYSGEVSIAVCGLDRAAPITTQFLKPTLPVPGGRNTYSTSYAFNRTAKLP